MMPSAQKTQLSAEKTQLSTEDTTFDCISRREAIDTLTGLEFCHYVEFGEYVGEDTREVRLIRAEKAQDALQKLPSVQRDTDEWCSSCKEYDTERHCCPRWNRVIRETLKDAQPEVIRCKDCVNHVDDRCLAANHHTGDTEYCMEVFGAKMKGEQP